MIARCLAAAAALLVGFAAQAQTYDDRKIAAQQTHDAVEQLAAEAAR